VTGFNILEIHTTLEPEKQLKRVAGQFNCSQLQHAPISGYEIHCGISTNTNHQDKPLIKLGSRSDGVINQDNNVLGTYLHGLFDQPESCNALLNWAGLKQHNAPDLNALREQQLNRLADTLERNLDQRLWTALGIDSTHKDGSIEQNTHSEALN